MKDKGKSREIITKNKGRRIWEEDECKLRMRKERKEKKGKIKRK